MRIMLVAPIFAISFGGAAMAQSHYVSGYTKANGTYVAPHVAANPGTVAPAYATPAYGSDHVVSGYTRSNGTYVAPYHATEPNSTKMDNYSTKGNVNPYTGQPGTKSPY